MLTVSQDFLNAIVAPHQIATTATVTVPGGTPTTLNLVSGQIQVDGTQMIRRQGQGLIVDGGSAVYDLLSTPGALVKISHGVTWSWRGPELVPVLTGELTDAAQTLGDGSVLFNVADYWQKVVESEFVNAYSPDPLSTRVAEITRQIQAAIPGTNVTDTSGDTSIVFTIQTWTSRSDLIATLAKDAGLEVFFTPTGDFVIRKEALPTASPVWSIYPDQGSGGNLTSLQRTVPLTQLYNYVTVVPGSTGGAQVWGPQVVQITDPTHPRYPGKIGTRPYTYTANSVQTAAQAAATAATILSRALGSTETLKLGALSNAALEAGDVISITNILDTGYSTVQHLISSYTLDLLSGAMTLQTRSDSEALH